MPAGTRPIAAASRTGSRPGLVELLDRHLAKNTPTMGAAGDEVTSRLARLGCDEEQVARWLEDMCSAARAQHRTFAALRRGALRDMLLLPLRALERERAAGPKTASADRRGLEVAAALLAAMADSLDPGAAARALHRLGASTATPALGVAAAIVERLWSEAPAFGRPDAEYLALVRALVAEKARERGMDQAAALAAVTEERVRALVAALRRVAAVGEVDGLAMVRDVAGGTLEAVTVAIELAGTGGLRLPAGMDGLLASVATGSLADVVDGVVGLMGATQAGQIPSGAIDVLRATSRLALARDGSEVSQALKVLVLGPWSERLLFDVNAGMPWIDLGELNFGFAGDLSLGYNGERFGVLGHVLGSAYNLDNEEILKNNLRAGGGIDVWHAWRVSSAWRLEGRLQASTLLYDSDVIVPPRTSTDDTRYADETSWMGRWLGAASAVPSLHGGLDLRHFAPPGAASETLALPVLGVGLRRDVY